MGRTVDDRASTIGPAEVSDRIGVTPETLSNWRYRGFGPRYIRVGGRIRYRISDIAEWLDACTRTSTSDAGPDV